jgi:hypothetical protein
VFARNAACSSTAHESGSGPTSSNALPVTAVVDLAVFGRVSVGALAAESGGAARTVMIERVMLAFIPWV